MLPVVTMIIKERNSILMEVHCHAGVAKGDQDGYCV